MITKKIILGLSMLALFALPATNVKAEVGFCSNVEVLMAGAQGSLGRILQLKNTRADCPGWPQNEVRFLRLDNSLSQANAYLAAALSAQASGLPIMVVPMAGFSYGSYTSLVGVYAQSAPNP